MRTLTTRHLRALDDLRSALEDSDDLSWSEAVWGALEPAWDALLDAGDPGAGQ